MARIAIKRQHFGGEDKGKDFIRFLVGLRILYEVSLMDEDATITLPEQDMEFTTDQLPVMALIEKQLKSHGISFKVRS